MSALSPTSAAQAASAYSTPVSVGAAAPLHGKKLLLILNPVNGLGDISCCFKVATQLIERAGLSQENILIATKHPEKVTLFNKQGFRVLSFDEAKSVGAIALQIIVPQNELSDGAVFYLNRCPTVAIAEYGFRPYTLPVINIPRDGVYLFRSFGLREVEKEIGILIDPALVAWGFSPEAENSLKRLGQLAHVSPFLLSGILGLGPFETQIATFDQRSKLYTGYCTNTFSLDAFLLAVMELNYTSRIRSITLVLPGRAALTLGNGMLKSAFSYYRLLNKMTIYMASSEDKNLKLHETCEGIDRDGFTITLIAGEITPQDMKRLFMASERETLVTGDQSLSEAISCNKSFVFEASEHKRTLRASLNEVWGDQRISFSLSENVPALAPVFRSHSLPSYRLTEINRRVCEQQDCFEKLLQLFIEAMAQSSQVVKYPKNFAAKPHKFSPDRIPFDRLCYVSNDQICELQIRHNGTSNLPQFAGSSFESSILGPGHFLRRKHTR